MGLQIEKGKQVTLKDCLSVTHYSRFLVLFYRAVSDAASGYLHGLLGLEVNVEQLENCRFARDTVLGGSR